MGIISKIKALFGSRKQKDVTIKNPLHKTPRKQAKQATPRKAKASAKKKPASAKKPKSAVKKPASAKKAVSKPAAARRRSLRPHRAPTPKKK